MDNSSFRTKLGGVQGGMYDVACETLDSGGRLQFQAPTRSYAMTTCPCLGARPGERMQGKAGGELIVGVLRSG